MAEEFTMRIAPLLLAAAMFGAVFALQPSAASAHARYESSTPAKGEILAVSPSEVDITFTQEIQRIAGKYSIDVTKDRGPSITAGAAVVNDEDRRQMSVALQPDLAAGRYVVRWTNVSDEDGDPAEGAFSFYVNHEPNAVDLENDRQLELIGAEGTASATSQASPAGETPTDAASAEASPVGTAESSPSPAPPAGEDDGGSSVSVVLIVVGVIVLAAILVGGGFLFLRSRTG
jgi:methionine-rich copper-binding protein CopC